MNGYHSEMGEKRPADTQIDAQLSHYGKHWYCKTDASLELKGRGITFLERSTQINGRVVNRYKVTEKAFELLCKTYRVSSEMLL